MPDEIKHHDFSPSRLNQFAICPGAYRMQLGLTETKSPDAEEGTMLHARVVSKNLDGLNEEQAASVQFCLDYLENLIRDREAEGKKVLHILFEEKVQVFDEDGTLLTEGIADVVVIYDDGTGDVIDWKFGRGEVPEVKENYQTAAYSVGVAQKYKLESVTAHIVQPRILKKNSYTFRRMKMVLGAVRYVIMKASSTGELIIRPTENGCKYCLAKSFCPAFAARFSALAVPETPRDFSNPDVLLDYWEKCQIVERFIGEVKKAVIAYVSEHGRLGDWVLTEKAGKREITDTAALYDRVSGLLTSRELAECYTVSVTAILDKLASGAVTRAAATGVKLSMKKAREDAEALLGDIIQKGKAFQTLTRRPEAEE